MWKRPGAPIVPLGGCHLENVCDREVAAHRQEPQLLQESDVLSLLFRQAGTHRMAEGQETVRRLTPTTGHGMNAGVRPSGTLDSSVACSKSCQELHHKPGEGGWSSGPQDPTGGPNQWDPTSGPKEQCIERAWQRPAVRVPVLSSSTTLARPRASSAGPPRISTPAEQISIVKQRSGMQCVLHLCEASLSSNRQRAPAAGLQKPPAAPPQGDALDRVVRCSSAAVTDG